MGQPGAHWPFLAECALAAVSTERCLVGLVGAAESRGAASTLSGGPRTPTSDKMSDHIPTPPPTETYFVSWPDRAATPTALGAGSCFIFCA